MSDPTDDPETERPNGATVTRRAFVVGAVSMSVACAATGESDDAGRSLDPNEPDEPALADAGAAADAGATTDTPEEDAGTEPDDACAETVPDALGPYWIDGSPERADLIEGGSGGTPIRVRGTVLARGPDCLPIAAAMVDFWHADDAGAYDNEGWLLRGHQLTDANGRYALRTILPGYYAPRPRHIHVRLTADGYEPLVTQLYFASDPQNAAEGTPRERLLLTLAPGADGEDEAEFHFVMRSLTAGTPTP
jgi:protocatechuate 3,4-dioxygenase beta subunit